MPNSKKAAISKSRNIKGTWTVEQSEDIGIYMEEELKKQLSEEIDNEIMGDMIALTTQYNAIKTIFEAEDIFGQFNNFGNLRVVQLELHALNSISKIPPQLITSKGELRFPISYVGGHFITGGKNN